MTTQPVISVILPLYNGERFVEGAVRSILQQSVGCFQIIAVDDAGKEPTLARVEAMRHWIEAGGHRLDVVLQASNSGIAAARNAGAAIAQGQYVSWLDQDDLWPAERTAILLNALQVSGAEVARGRMRFIDLAPEVERPWVRDHWFSGDHPGYVLGALLCRTEVLAYTGPLTETMREGGGDDVDWFMRLRHCQVSVAEVDEVTVVRQIHEANQSGRASQSELLAAVRAHLQRNRDQL
jgi:glycosyltransferase involved in cell wall biosynthesis